MKKNKIVLGYARIMLVIIAVLQVHIVTHAGENPPRDFPSIFIETDPEVWVDRETWFAGQVAISSPNSDQSFYAVEADIRGRGNSTWIHGEDKRPLRFRFPEGEERRILQFEHEARTWVLLSNHFDLSLMRNFSMYYLASLLDGLYWTPVVQFVHLYVNDEYMGLYLLTDERDIGEGRARLTLDGDPTISEFFLERDRRASRGDARAWLDYVQVHGVTYDIRFPNNVRRTVEQGKYIYNFLYNVSYVIRSRDWENISAILDIDSFVDFYIVQEFSRDPDAGFSSIFMQVKWEDEERILHMGPVWDFDIALGNNPGSRPTGIRAADRHYWFGNLIMVPEFQELVRERWEEIRENQLLEMVEKIEYLTYHYIEAFYRNFERHPILGTGEAVWRNHERVLEIDTFMGQIEYLFEFMEARANWFSDFLSSDTIEINLMDRDFIDPNAEREG